MDQNMIDYITGFCGAFAFGGALLLGAGVAIGVGVSHKLWSDFTKGPRPYQELKDVKPEGK